MHRFFIRTFAIGLLIVAASSALGQESAEDSIRKRIQQYEEASNAGSFDSMAAIYAVNGTHTLVNGQTLRGRDEIANGLKQMYSGILKGSHMAITPLHIRLLSAETAVEEASFVLSGLKDAGGGELPPMNGFCLVVYQKDGDQWYIAAAQCMVPPPMPQ